MDAPDIESAKTMFPNQERQVDHPSQTFTNVVGILQKHLLLLEILSDVWAAMVIHPSDGAALPRNDDIVGERRCGHVRNDRVEPEGIGARFI